MILATSSRIMNGLLDGRNLLFTSYFDSIQPRNKLLETSKLAKYLHEVIVLRDPTLLSLSREQSFDRQRTFTISIPTSPIHSFPRWHNKTAKNPAVRGTNLKRLFYETTYTWKATPLCTAAESLFSRADGSLEQERGLEQSSRGARDKVWPDRIAEQTRKESIGFRVGVWPVVPLPTWEGVPVGGSSWNRVRPTLWRGGFHGSTATRRCLWLEPVAAVPVPSLRIAASARQTGLYLPWRSVLARISFSGVVPLDVSSPWPRSWSWSLDLVVPLYHTGHMRHETCLTRVRSSPRRSTNWGSITKLSMLQGHQDGGSIRVQVRGLAGCYFVARFTDYPSACEPFGSIWNQEFRDKVLGLRPVAPTRRVDERLSVASIVIVYQWGVYFILRANVTVCSVLSVLLHRVFAFNRAELAAGFSEWFFFSEMCPRGRALPAHQTTIIVSSLLDFSFVFDTYKYWYKSGQKEQREGASDVFECGRNCRTEESRGWSELDGGGERRGRRGGGRRREPAQRTPSPRYRQADPPGLPPKQLRRRAPSAGTTPRQQPPWWECMRSAPLLPPACTGWVSSLCSLGSLLIGRVRITKPSRGPPGPLSRRPRWSVDDDPYLDPLISAEFATLATWHLHLEQNFS